MVTGALVHDRNFKIVATNTQKYAKTHVNEAKKNYWKWFKMNTKSKAKQSHEKLFSVAQFSPLLNVNQGAPYDTTRGIVTSDGILQQSVVENRRLLAMNEK